MTLHQLRIFNSMAKHLNVTKAALEVHLTQSAVSQQLKLLEQEYGKRFYIRTNQGVELTRQGRAFLQATKPILSLVEDVKKMFRLNQDKNTEAFIAVGGTHGPSVNVIPAALKAFKAIHPFVKFIVETNDSHTMERRILSSDVEIALITNPSQSSHIVYEPYEELEIVAFASSTSPLIGRKISIEDLTHIPLVVKSRGRIPTELLNLGCQLNIAVQCETSEAVKANVRRGLGVGILYRDVIDREVKKGELKIINVPDLKKIEGQSFIIYDKRKSPSSIAQNFLQTLLARRAIKIQRTAKMRIPSGLVQDGRNPLQHIQPFPAPLQGNVTHAVFTRSCKGKL